MLHLTVGRFSSNTKTTDKKRKSSIPPSKIRGVPHSVYSSTNVSFGFGGVHAMWELANAQGPRSDPWS